MYTYTHAKASIQGLARATVLEIILCARKTLPFDKSKGQPKKERKCQKEYINQKTQRELENMALWPEWQVAMALKC